MGVPKFFRWISERYPKINQPIHAPPHPDTLSKYFPGYGSESNDNDNDDNNNSGSINSSSANMIKNKKSKEGLHQDHKVYIQKNSITPEFDRLYLDMNGIIHCSSHNNASDDNATVDPDTHIEANGNTTTATATATATNGNQLPIETQAQDGTVKITEAEIFRNVCYYVDRVVSDIAKPTELVYMAIDGVAPRAKMNQQRSRRYRSGKEKEIENTFYGAHLLAQKKKLKEETDANANNSAGAEQDYDHWDIQGVGGLDPNANANANANASSFGSVDPPSANLSKDKPSFSTKSNKQKQPHAILEEVEPGRFTGTFETTGNDSSSTSSTSSSSQSSTNSQSSQFDLDYQAFLHQTLQKPIDQEVPSHAFHSNTITPGTPFFERCTAHLQHFVQLKLQSDPRWKDLTIIFSGPGVPGEGEHKIMDFIRRQKTREDYNPNTTHCMFGQDGDLIMLGLATHEPHFALLREEVVFDQSRKREHQKMAEMRAKLFREKLKKGASGGNGGEDDEGVASEKVSASIDSYIHNSNFEVLHMPILRDYLAYEFETREVLPNSPFELEKTIDDFVFMTFIVGNDFLVSLWVQC